MGWDTYEETGYFGLNAGQGCVLSWVMTLRLCYRRSRCQGPDELDGVAPLVADPAQSRSNLLKNPAI